MSVVRPSGAKTLAQDNCGNLMGDGTWAFTYDPLVIYDGTGAPSRTSQYVG